MLHKHVTLEHATTTTTNSRPMGCHTLHKNPQISILDLLNVHYLFSKTSFVNLCTFYYICPSIFKAVASKAKLQPCLTIVLPVRRSIGPMIQWADTLMVNSRSSTLSPPANEVTRLLAEHCLWLPTMAANTPQVELAG